MSPAPPQSLPTIAWLTSGHEGYGVRQAIFNLARGMEDLGCGIRMFALSPGPFYLECREAGFVTEHLDAARPPVLRPGAFAKAGGLLRLAAYQRRGVSATLAALRKHNIDVLHFNWPTFALFAGMAARRMGIECYWEMVNCVGGGYPFQLNRRFYQWVCSRYDVRPLANSRFTAASLGHHPVEPIVFHLGVDPGRFDPDTVVPVARADLGIPQDATVLTICARMEQVKGQDRVLQAMLHREVRDHNLHLLLVGGPIDGDYAQSLRQIVRDADAEHRLHFAGLVPDPHRYYAASDIVINSRVDPEPFGLTVVEAMLMNRPLLVHALGGPAETVVDGETGWHVPSPTIDAFVTGLKRAIGDRTRWTAMGRAGRARALANFTVPVMARRYLDILLARRDTSSLVSTRLNPSMEGQS